MALQPCTQTINVDHVSDFAVEFPADVTINCGANVPNFGEPEIFYETCELVAVTSDDRTYNVVADACYKIVRTWTVINWCVVGSEIDQEVVEQPENQLGLAFPACDIDNDGDCDARTFRDSWRGSVPVPNPFAPTAYRLRPFVNDAHTPNTNPVLNFRNPDTDIDTDPWDGYITYQQVIKVQDNVDPVFTNGCVCRRLHRGQRLHGDDPVAGACDHGVQRPVHGDGPRAHRRRVDQRLQPDPRRLPGHLPGALRGERQLQQPDPVPEHGDGEGLQEAYALLQERRDHRDHADLAWWRYGRATWTLKQLRQLPADTRSQAQLLGQRQRHQPALHLRRPRHAGS
ncbi:MAG: hypothetical protein IPN76_03450 [Saprospiraceae bacterium]|nr:hypothetical protein [Saprospiraceae bacterium]